MLRDISSNSLARALDNRIGLIPVSLNGSERKIQWLDVGQYHFYQGFFSDALRVCAALRNADSEELVSDLDDLRPIHQCLDSILPSAFIFHAGRCGSTLLSKILARSREHLVFGEAAPHNQIWNLLPPDPTLASDLYRRLIVAMGRRRLPSYRAHIIKFTSFNILQAQFIRASFPGVPALFIFRRPDALLDSYHRGHPSWLGSEVNLVSKFETAESAVEAFFAAALSVGGEDFQYLDYDRLTPESLPGILRYLRLTPPAGDIPLMLNEFLWNSKTRAVPARFIPRQADYTCRVSPALEDLYRQMKERCFDPCNQRS